MSGRLFHVVGFRALLLAVLAAGAGMLAFAPAAHAQTTEFQRSYIDPFPRGDRYRILVIGDSLAEGLWSGLYRAFEEDPTIEVVNRAKTGTGFTRGNYDWTTQLDTILKEEVVQIAVVMFGANDNQGIKSGEGWLKAGSEAWDEAYGKKVEALIKKLRAQKIAVYWTGLPIMRGEAESEDAELLNDIYRERSFINSAKFIDTWSGFTDESGRYSAVGPDMTGQVRRLRADDGLHFTMRGYLKLAHFVEKEIRRDLSLAKLERNIPLAGSDDEQAKVMGRAVDSRANPALPELAPAPTVGSAAPAEGEEKPEQVPTEVEQSKVGEVEVVRPVIPNTTLEAAQNLTPQSAGPSVPDSENVTAELPGGLTALASISAVSDPTVASSKPRLPLTQRPYYRVLIKGEQLKPKAGRADDFAWPPS
jgi:hypothetical protein